LNPSYSRVYVTLFFQMLLSFFCGLFVCLTSVYPYSIWLNVVVFSSDTWVCSLIDLLFRVFRFCVPLKLLVLLLFEQKFFQTVKVICHIACQIHKSVHIFYPISFLLKSVFLPFCFQILLFVLLVFTAVIRVADVILHLDNSQIFLTFVLFFFSRVL